MSTRGRVHFEGITKMHGAFRALKGVDFEIEPGEFFVANPVEVEIGGATVFVLRVERYERIG